MLLVADQLNLDARIEALSRQIEALTLRLDAIVANLNKSPIGVNSEYVLYGRKRVADDGDDRAVS